jgi:hypothetical protein
MPVKYNEVIDMAFLAQFDLLQHSRSGLDVRKAPWADPATRVLTDKYFELQRAKEEISRLNVEWRRLTTWISDEGKLYKRALELLSTEGSDTHLLDAVQRHWKRTRRIHYINSKWLTRTQNLSTFSASLTPGKAIRPEFENISFDTQGSSGDFINPVGQEPTETLQGIGEGEEYHEDLGMENTIGMEGCLGENSAFDSFLAAVGSMSI